ncbi:hypothetical protein [Verminephrobacter eiseniae]|nr:hypothetical protein [Verminephrobacter eiseniae]
MAQGISQELAQQAPQQLPQSRWPNGVPSSVALTSEKVGAQAERRPLAGLGRAANPALRPQQGA